MIQMLLSKRLRPSSQRKKGRANGRLHLRALDLSSLHGCVETYRGFKSLKQLTKLTFRLKRFEQSSGYYSRLLPYTKKAVTRK